MAFWKSKSRCGGRPAAGLGTTQQLGFPFYQSLPHMVQQAMGGQA
jgi:hypothetical protein